MQIQETEGSAPAWVSDPKHPQYSAAATATQMVYGQQPDLIREGGSIPITITLQVYNQALTAAAAADVISVQHPFLGSKPSRERPSITDFLILTPRQRDFFFQKMIT